MKALWPASLHFHEQTRTVDASSVNGQQTPTGRLPCPISIPCRQGLSHFPSKMAKHGRQWKWQRLSVSRPVEGFCIASWLQDSLGPFVLASVHDTKRLMLRSLLMAAGSMLQPGTPGRGSLKASAPQLRGQGLLFCGLRVRMSIASGIAEVCHTNAEVGDHNGRVNMRCKAGLKPREINLICCTDCLCWPHVYGLAERCTMDMYIVRDPHQQCLQTLALPKKHLRRSAMRAFTQ